MLRLFYRFEIKINLMNLKLSCNFSRDEIEKDLSKTFLYPKIQKPRTLIDSDGETHLAVITASESTKINFAIWGLLPSNYEGSWERFQQAFDTHQIEFKKAKNSNYLESFHKSERCLIITSGFFMHHYHEGELYPLYIHRTDNKVICLAGIYTILEDGFLTCSLFTSKSNKLLSEVRSFDSETPLIIPDHQYENWLSDNLMVSGIDEQVINAENKQLEITPISKELFYNNIVSESSLEKVAYQELNHKLKKLKNQKL